MDGAPVRLFIRGADVWREEPQWPLARAQLCALFPAQGALRQRDLAQRRRAVDRAAGGRRGADRLCLSGLGMGQRRGRRTAPDGRPDPVRRVLTFTSAPLAADLEVTGPIVLELHASSDQIDTRFIVKLADQAPQEEAARAKGAQPAFTNVSKGWLQASHREKDRDPHDRAAAVLHPHQSAAAHARRDLPVRHRDAADRICVQEGPPHPAGDRQRRLAADRRRVHPSLSADGDRNGHDPPRAAHPSCLLLPVVKS